MNGSANFLKHADRDINAIHEMDEDETDPVIIFASKWCRDLGSSLSLEMRAFVGWFVMCHPNTLTASAKVATPSVASESPFHLFSEELLSLPRVDRLKIGLPTLQHGRNL